jgi:hypothetical protein
LRSGINGARRDVRRATVDNVPTAPLLMFVGIISAVSDEQKIKF